MRRLVAVLVLAVAVLAVASVVRSAIRTDQHGARTERISIKSRAVGRTLPVSVVVPGGSSDGKRPLLVFLHGRNNDEKSNLLDGMYAALEDTGERAPVVVFPYGGDHSYWHDRRDGRWGAYVLREVIPQVAKRFGADARRVAIAGNSMGGFGAYDLARLNPHRFCAAGGHSPALWRTGGETAPGAFDDAEDFARHDVIRGSGSLRGLPLWLDAGDRDPFQPGIRAFVGSLRSKGIRITTRTWEGGHADPQRDRHWRGYMAFYSRALANCR